MDKIPLGQERKVEELKRIQDIATLGEVQEDTSPIDHPESKKPENDYLGLLKLELSTPFLVLLERYLQRTSGKQKSSEQAMKDFRKDHPVWFKVCFFLDGGLKLVYLLILIVFILRALWILEYVAEITKKFYC